MADKDFVVRNGLIVNTNLIFANTGKVGINNSSPDAALTVTGTANVSGNVALGANLAVTGKATFSNTILVSGAANTGNLVVTGTANISSATNLGGNLIVSGVTTLTGNVTMSANASVATRLTVGSQINVGSATINSTHFTGAALTANDSAYFAGQLPSYYTALAANASNLSDGTVPSGRITGSYTGITAVGTLAGVTATGNSNFDSGVLFVDGTNNRVGINNTTPDASLTITGTANVSGNMRVGGDLSVGGNLTYTGTSVGDIVPPSNSYFLGNTTNRWTLLGLTGNFVTSVKVGNSSVNVTVNSTAFTGAVNAALLTSIVPAAALPQANATTNGSVLILDSVTNTSIAVYAASANSVKTAYDVAIAANTRAAQAYTNAIAFSGNAAAAYANAVAYANLVASNAAFMNSGTVDTARISGSYTGITAVGTLAGLAVIGNTNFDSGVLFVDGTNNRVGIGNTIPSVSLQISATDAVLMPSGNTGQRPTGANGQIRYNTETNQFEGYANGGWGAIAGTGGAYYKGNQGTVGNSTDKGNLYKLNSNTQTANVTISAGENAMTVGPMVVDSGVVLYVEAGGRMVVI